NAKTTSFCPLGFELDLAFELCHLSLSRLCPDTVGMKSAFGIWDFVLEERSLSLPYPQIE
ncbi:MAG: hypothetical protein MUO61_01675, partial [Dehalococcoidia bacterium]|nr:hypothetical protein [Dehalococcoidia bacterium]